MSRLTKLQIENRQAKVADETIPLAERKVAQAELMGAMLNPKPAKDFDPATFDPMEGVENYEIKKRPREEPPLRLPRNGLLPKKIYEGQMIGMFESKQDLYLMIALLSERVSDLEEEVSDIRTFLNL